MPNYGIFFELNSVHLMYVDVKIAQRKRIIILDDYIKLNIIPHTECWGFDLSCS